jgi:hypothetical protein
LSSLLGLALECPVLSMDTMTAESDTAMAIGVPGSTWARRAGYAVDPHKLLEAAHQATVHAVSKGVDDGQESMPWDEP